MQSPGSPLAGQRALLVGSTHLPLRAVALALASAGADVALASATTDPEEMFEVRRIAKAVAAAGRGTFSQGWDVTLPVNVQVGLKQLLKEFGRPSILVYAADAPLERPLERTTDAEFARVQQVNLHGAFYTARSFVRECVPEGPGRIIFLTPATPAGGVAASAYASARAGVTGLAAALAAELAPRGVTVNCVVADPADTAATAGLVVALVADAAGTVTGRLLHPGDTVEPG